MRKDKVKFIKEIKEILNFLNSAFPSKDYPKFCAYLPPDNDPLCLTEWHIATDDYFLYMGKSEEAEEFKICKEAIRTKFKKFKMIFCFQHAVTSRVQKTRGYLLVLK